MGRGKGADMPRGKNIKPEMVVTTLRKVEVLVAQGLAVEEACKQSEITKQTYYRWKKEFGNLEVDQAKRLKELTHENARLKKLVAELALDKEMLKEIAKGNF
jgi:transposase-like protein